MSAKPLTGLDFALIGPGRVGRSLASWMKARGARCLGVAGRDGSSTAAIAAVELDTRAATIEELPERLPGLLLIAVPDDAAAQVARRAAARGGPRFALHTSGRLGASVLAPLAALGSAVGSLHPLRAFPQAQPDPAAARGIVFAIDGDPAARAVAIRITNAFAAEAVVVPEAARALYHLGAVLSAGGVVTLLTLAEEFATAAALPPEIVRGYLRLAAQSISLAAAATHPGDALTGPVTRGDVDTVRAELAATRQSSPAAHPFVLALFRETLRQTARGGPGNSLLKRLAEALERPEFLDPA